ncbi:MAG: hypothetical protein J5819_10210 [Eubacterium sp.]|nr:hypothetical protein [Eubacterium sp.]
MKKRSKLEKQRERQHKMVEQRFTCDVDSIEIVLEGLRHLYTYCDVYWLTCGHAIRPQRLKQLLIHGCHEPESTARSHVKALVEGDHGLFYYIKDQGVLALDKEYVDDFLCELQYLLCIEGDWECKLPEDAYTESGYEHADDTDVYWDEVYGTDEDTKTKQDPKDEKNKDLSS